VGAYELWTIKQPDWNKATVESGSRFLRAFLPRFAQRFEYLSTLTDVSWVYAREPIQELRAPLARFGAWVDSLSPWDYFPKAGKRAKVTILNPGVADHLRSIERELQEQPIWLLNETGKSLRLDIAMMIGEFLRVRYPWVVWSVEHRKILMEYGHPHVSGFGKYHDSLPVLVVAAIVLSNARGGAFDRVLLDAMPIWTDQIKVPAPDRTTRKGAKKPRRR